MEVVILPLLMCTSIYWLMVALRKSPRPKPVGFRVDRCCRPRVPALLHRLRHLYRTRLRSRAGTVAGAVIVAGLLLVWRLCMPQDCMPPEPDSSV